MSNPYELTDDQLKMIEATLKRIRGGLRKFTATLPEPSHGFTAGERE
ncbi:MAG: hypothetical protein KL863_13320 [Rhizobium sp.]|nr:hypothetical protein [Rhizobium sp.]